MAKASKKPTPRRRRGSSLLAETLESRLLFSADPLTQLLGWHDSVGDLADTHNSVFPIKSASDGHRIDSTDATRELVLINSDVPDVHVLQQAVLGLTADRPMAVYLLDASQDGIEQLTRILGSHNDVEAIHILSHGSSGSVALGGTTLDVNTTNERETHLVKLRTHFSEHADILLYGCDIAADDNSLLDALAETLLVDVAASEDLTGNPILNGDWDLEAYSGLVERSSLFLTQAAEAWSGVLLNVTVTTTLDEFDIESDIEGIAELLSCLLYTSPSPRDS